MASKKRKAVHAELPLQRQFAFPEQGRHFNLREIFDRIRADRPVATDAEITLEANPDDINPDAAARWRAAGVNRVSLGVQSFDPGVLVSASQARASPPLQRCSRSSSSKIPRSPEAERRLALSAHNGCAGGKVCPHRAVSARSRSALLSSEMQCLR